MIATAAALSGSLFFGAATLRAGLGDLATLRIPNRLTLLMLAVWAVMAPLAGMPLTDMALAAACAAGLFILGYLCFALGWIGGGDAKLATVMALWLGAGQVVPFLLLTALFGGVLTLILLQFRMLPLPLALAGRGWAERLHAPANGVPYGVAIAAAGLTVFRDTHWLSALL